MRYIFFLFLFYSLSVSAQSYQDTLRHLKANTYPLKSFTAGQGFEDLKPLKKVLADRRIVSMGEATHGTREFFQLKHRMFEFLVSEMGFTVFGIEANFSACVPINEYVLTGKGDPKAALLSIYAPFWETREVLEMIEWMKNYNLTAPEGKKVKFYGIDMQQSYDAQKAIEHYFARVDPGYFSSLDTLKPMPERQRIELTADTAMVRKWKQQITDNQQKYTSLSSEKDWQLALQHTTILEQQTQGFSIYYPGITPDELRQKSIEMRDGYMAANVQWILNYEGGKMMLWAHNAHVSEGGDPDYRDKSMGAQLKKVYGDSLYTIGFDFGEGSFNSISRQTYRLERFSVPPAKQGSFAAAFRGMDSPAVLMEFSTALRNRFLSPWLTAPLRIRDLGASYDPANAPYSFVRCVLPDCFDAIIFVQRGNAAAVIE